MENNSGKRESKLIDSIIWSQIKRITPFRAVALYAVIGGVWILFSDRILELFVKDRSLYMQLSTAKGWLYVVVTAVLLYFLFYWGINSLQESEEALLESHQELLLTHGELASRHQEMEATHEELVAAEEELQQQLYEVQKQEVHYRRIFEGISSGILIQNRLGKILHANDAARRMLKSNCTLISGPTPDNGGWQAKYSDGTPFIWEKLAEGVFLDNTVSSLFREIEVTDNNGMKSWISLHSDPIQNPDLEDVQEMVTTLVDITEKKQLETFERLLKEIDQMVFRETPLALIHQILCEQLVTEMGFTWAWIGTKEDDGTVALRAQSGNEEQEKIIVRWDDSVQGQGVMGRAIRTGKHQIHKVEGNPFFAAWEELLTSNGLRSVAAFPLTHWGETFGALGLYSDKVDFFNDKRITVLEHFSLQLALAFNAAKDREHLERYRLLAEDAMDIILFIRPDGQIFDASDSAVKRYGYTYQELTHMPIQQLHFNENQLDVADILQKAQQGIHFESIHCCKGGSVFPVEVNAKEVFLMGSPIILSIIRDITERKQGEAAIWLEKERAQVTLASIGDAVITTDVRGVVEYLNPIAETLTGWTNADAVGHPLEKVFQIVHEETGGTIENPIVRCLKEGRVVGLANHTSLIHRKGTVIAIEDSAAPIRDRNEAIIGGVLVFRDVCNTRNLIKELAYQANHDALTGLPNRILFNDHLSLALAQARRKQSMLAVLFLDLDRFKQINDTMGHNIGDLLLKSGSERLALALREGDTIARQGGDEFLVLLPEINQEEEAAMITERILEVFLKPFVLDDNEVFISTSIGISIYPYDGHDIETLVKHADTAMYFAKEQGRSNYQFFSKPLPIEDRENRVLNPQK